MAETIFPTQSHFLLANGYLPRLPFAHVGNASVDSGLAHITEDTHGWCLHPDFADERIAHADTLDLVNLFDMPESRCDALKQMHARMIGLAGTGSWPAYCRPNIYPHKNSHIALVWIDVDSFLANNSVNRAVTDEEWQTVVVDARVWPSLERPVQSVEECKRIFVYGGPVVAAYDRPQWAQRSNKQEGETFTMFDMSTWLCMETCRRTGVLYHEVFDGENGVHNVHERMIPMSPNLGGYAYFNDGTCGDHVTSNIQKNRTYSLGRFTGLRGHEGYPGHTGGLGHDFRSPQSAHRSMMSYAQDNTPYQGFRLAGAPYQYVEDHSWPELRRYFATIPAIPFTESGEPPTGGSAIIPGVMAGEVLDDGTIKFGGKLGPVPSEAVGKNYIVQRMGRQSNDFRLIPESQQ